MNVDELFFNEYKYFFQFIKNKMENKMDDLYYYLKSLILVPQKDNNVIV
jgi:hypothetical protein